MARGQDRPVRGGRRRGGPLPAGGARRPGRLGLLRATRARGVRRRRRRRARDVHRHRGGRPRLCVRSSLIPAVNKLGSLPLILAAPRTLKQKYLPPLAQGKTTFSYGLSEREAGLRHGVDEVPRQGGRRRLGPVRAEVVDHQRRRLRVLHGPRRHRPRRRRAATTSPPSSSRSPTRASPSVRRSASSASRAAPRASCTSTTSASPATGSSASSARASRSRCARSTTPA